MTLLKKLTISRKDAKENAEPSSYSLLKIVVYVIKFSPILKIFAALRLCVKLSFFLREIIPLAGDTLTIADAA